MIIENRIKKHSEFQNVIENGRVIRASSFTFYYLKTNLGFTRIGISVPKKSGNAVIRNKIKRQVRACFACLTDYKDSLDLILIVRKSYDTQDFLGSKEQIKEFLEKVRNISEEEK